MARFGSVVLLGASLSLPLGLGGCQTNEQSYGAGGAVVGAVACGLVGRALFHNAAGTLGSAAACGAAGYFIGSSIGRQLDERDRSRATAATQQALNAPVRYGYNDVDVVRPRVRAASWRSDHGTGNRGSAQVVEARREPQGGECKTVREIAYIKGQEQTQESKYCRSSSEGEWQAT